ncbi:MAG: hypothetical protein ACTSR8_12940 [Promethearchaeota archaeon]
MQFPKCIEGDYIETKKDSLIFDVKGLLHPKDRKICFIRFYPHPSGDRIRDGIKYKKIYNLDQRYQFLRENYPEYLFYSEQMGLELQGVKNEEIKKIYTPRDYFNQLQEKKELNRLEKCSLELCNVFIREGDLPENSIGITGSPIVGLDNDGSDIDIIIYGTDVSRSFQPILAKLLRSGNYCREYNMQEYQKHYNWRAGGSDICMEDFLFSERRKLHQGMYKGFEFFIRYIKSPQDWALKYEDFSYENYGRIKIMAYIVDASDSIFTPCKYKIRTLDIIDGTNLFEKVHKDDISKVLSYRGRFCEHAKKGENVEIVGKIEKINYKSKPRGFQLILTNQETDKMRVMRK